MAILCLAAKNSLRGTVIVRPGESIRLIDGSAKSLRLKRKLKKNFAAAVYLSEAPF
jgi:hypothetical protein